MPPNVIEAVPEFTKDETLAEEVKEGEVISTPEGGEDISQKETETLPEPPAEEKPASEDDNLTRDDIKGLQKQISGLQREREKLLNQVVELKGQRREIKYEELQKVNEKIDDLKDINPEDAEIIEKVLRAKGYVTKEQTHQMYYDAVKQDELNKFLVKYPEYKAENDPNDTNWNALQAELRDYKMPSDPHEISRFLEKAHHYISKTFDDRGAETKKRQIQTASMGGGGVQRSSSKKSLNPSQRLVFEQGGWSEEEIKQIEQSL